MLRCAYLTQSGEPSLLTARPRSSFLWVFALQPIPSTSPFEECSALCSAARPRLLIVDDEPDMLRMITFVLEKEGFDVETVESGEAAIRRFGEQGFDLVLTDLKMPGLDGFSTLRALRAIDPALKVIIATGYASKETGDSCRRAGAFGLILKPFELTDLLAMLNRALTSPVEDARR